MVSLGIWIEDQSAKDLNEVACNHNATAVVFFGNPKQSIERHIALLAEFFPRRAVASCVEATIWRRFCRWG